MLARRSSIPIHADPCLSMRSTRSSMRNIWSRPPKQILPMFLVIVLVLCECQAIRVPVVWDEKPNSEVSDQVESFPVTLQQQTPQQSIPTEYFEYKAHKPQFAVEIADFHGVKDPQNHYKAYPVRPYTGKAKPELGKHHMLDENKTFYKPYQQYVNGNEEWQSHIIPTASSYEVFHPYKAEEPALQELYKDPILDKIRNDLKTSKNYLQKYEKDAGEANIEEGEYLESPEQTDQKKIPHKNIPASFEIHRPLRRPVYYRPPPNAFRHEQILNHKFRHPWNQNFVKVRPLHYRPLKNHLHNLRQHHALKYDDEHNEYPQVPPSENFAEPPDGYDIYLKGQDRYNQLRNNIDESINKATLKNRPAAYQKLELQSKDTKEESNVNDFVPIKSYAQVRKTETTKHLPKSAALVDATSYDDIVNAHRLKEAVKSTKAQTVYSEEGYEDAAYDHAGEQKHASDHEGHGGFLKESEISGGKYKTPSFSGKYQDASGSVYRDKKKHGKKWKDDDTDKEDQNDSEDYSEDEHEHLIEEDAYGNVPDDDIWHKREHDTDNDQDHEDTKDTLSHVLQDEEEEKEDTDEDTINTSNNNDTRHKRENYLANTTDVTKNLNNDTEIDHGVDKREVNFVVPEFDYNSTLFNEKEFNKIAKLKVPKLKKSNLRDKYPYYFRNLKSVNKNSPLRYAENLKLIPLKSKGGTEFYDSRSNIECAEVDDEVDPVPTKIKNNGTNTSEENDDNDDSTKADNEKFDNLKNKQRLKGLGDKIDCFKAKYFGKNPLDSPFFNEELIGNPEPIKTPNLETFKINNFGKISSLLKDDNFKTATDLVALRGVLNNGTTVLQDTIAKATEGLKSSLELPQNIISSNDTEKNRIYADIVENIKKNFHESFMGQNKTKLFDSSLIANSSDINAEHKNTSYYPFTNKENVYKSAMSVRQKRAAPFIYEPYKIIREGQNQDSKKTTTTSNISPLIKQLQTSKIVEKVLTFSHDKDQPVKRNVGTHIYKDISRKNREKYVNKGDRGFIDISVDRRRGEPRYELKPANHKTHYSPVDHKKSMSVEDYETQTNKTITPSKFSKLSNPNFVESKFSPSSLESAASKTISQVVSTTSIPKPLKKVQKPVESEESEEDYDEYEDDEESTTTTTTIKPSFRRRARPTTTTEKPQDDYVDEEEESTEPPKLRLITRFHKPHVTDKPVIKKEISKYKPTEIDKDDDDDLNTPKYREKKKKTRKSTLVTDTKRYGDDDDDMRKEEIDAMIGVKQNMDDYMPNYEKEADNVMESIKKKVPDSSEEDDNDDYNEEEDEDDQEDDENNGDDDDNDSEEEDDEISTADKEEEFKKEEKSEPIILTTPEPTKRTLLKTTEAPISTTEARSAKIEIKPVIHRKKVEIHKEIPVNISAPHITQFRQDIKEVEIIKELPQKRKKPQKNVEALNLFKDENLASEINKLKDVEIFKENLDLKQGPRHGGNYRAAEIKSAPVVSSTQIPLRRRVPTKQRNFQFTQQPEELNINKDTGVILRHGRRSKSNKDEPLNDNEQANAKHIELSDVDTHTHTHALHGGNLKSLQDNFKSRGNNRSAKLIELDEEYDDNDSGDMHGGNFKSYDNSRSGGGLHGGNYRSAKLVQAEQPDDSEKKHKETLQSRSKITKSGRHDAAALLNGFAKAVPILTTTPNYIKDPSKRMYYYVDT